MSISGTNSICLSLEVRTDGENDPLLTPQNEEVAAEVAPLSPEISPLDHASISMQEDLIEAVQQDHFSHFENLLRNIDSTTLSSAPYFLASACWCDDGRYIRAALQAGINPNIIIKDGVITETYQRLRKHALTDTSMFSDHHRKSRRAIHIAAGSDNFKVLEALLDHPDTDKEAIDSSGDTWLHYFARKPYVEPFIDKERNYSSKDLLQRIESKKIINIQNNNKNTFLHLAALNARYDLMESVLRNDDLGLDVGLKNDKENTALHLLANNNPEGKNETSSQMMCTKLLIKNVKEINDKNKQGKTALHVAAASGNYFVMRALLTNKDMDICIKDNENYTAFHRLALNNSMSDECMLWCTRMFFKLDALDVNVQGTNGKTPLHLCAQSGNSVMFKELVRHHDIQVSKKDSIERTVIHYMATARKNKYSDKTKKNLISVLDKGIQINAQDKHGQTALHIAAMENFPEMIYVLLDHGADILKKNNREKSVVDIIQPNVLKTYMNMCMKTSGMSHENNFTITYNYKFLLSNMRESSSSTSHVESSIPFALSTNPYLHNLLCHPLITSFLHLKWHKWRFILFAHVALYIIVMFILNMCIITQTMTTLNNLDIGYSNTAQNNIMETKRSSFLTTMHILLPISVVFLLGKLLIPLISFPFKYSINSICLLELLVCISSVYFTISFWLDLSVNMYLSFTTTVVSWLHLILLTGSLPVFSVNLEMLKTVLITFIKYFSWYFTIIMGFAFSFLVLLYSSNKHIPEPFLSPWSSVKQTMLLMTGQGDPSDLSTEYMPVISDIMIMLFLIIIVVVLLNLLSGLAIGDTEAIRKQARLLSYKSMVSYIHGSETMLKYSKKLLVSMTKLQKMTQIAQCLKNSNFFTVQPNKPDKSSPYSGELQRFCGELLKIRNFTINSKEEFFPTTLSGSIIEATKEVLQEEDTICERLCVLESKLNNICDILEKRSRLK